MRYIVNRIDGHNYVVRIVITDELMGELKFNKISEGTIMDVWGCSDMRLDPVLFVHIPDITPKDILQKSKSLVEFEEYPYAQEPSHNID